MSAGTGARRGLQPHRVKEPAASGFGSPTLRAVPPKKAQAPSEPLTRFPPLIGAGLVQAADAACFY